MRAFASLFLYCTLLSAAQAAAPVLLLVQQGAIGPASADYLQRGFDRARALDAQLIVIEIDTPGGLDLSMRAIVRGILESPVPVASFVSPNGARAASAGTYILYASHLAAMAPASNLGAATPVTIGAEPGVPGPDDPTGAPASGETTGPEDDSRSNAASAMRKQTSDAAAYIRSLAQLRGRNAEWADQAVRDSVSLSAREALELKVVDLVATDIPDLLRQVDGRTLTAGGAQSSLDTDAAPLIEYRPDWRSRLLMIITDPGIAYLLLVVGFYGLLFEFYSPGLVAPGVIGGICLLLALYALQLLPVSYTGLALIALGIGLMVAEHFAPGFGMLGLGGIVAFATGSVMLIDTDDPAYRLPWQLIVSVAAGSAALLLLALGYALRARQMPVVSGAEEMLGLEGAVTTAAGDDTFATVHGELWKVRAGVPLERGESVRVVGIEGLVLLVEPVAKGGRT